MESLRADKRLIIESADSNSETPLSWALRKSHSKVVKLLLHAGTSTLLSHNNSFHFHAAFVLLRSELESMSLGNCTDEHNLFSLQDLFHYPE